MLVSAWQAPNQTAQTAEVISEEPVEFDQLYKPDAVVLGDNGEDRISAAQ